jgi:hypothetical protein
MDYIIEAVKNNQKIILVMAIIILAVLCIVIFKKIVKNSKKAKELSLQAEEKIRDENLNNIILNNNTDNLKLRKTPKPYDVDYSSSNNGKLGNIDSSKDKKNSIMIQLIERTELSTRKFILNPTNGLRIGSDTQGNDIVVFDSSVSQHQCEIFTYGDKIYIKNLGSESRTIVKRKKESVIVDGTNIRLLSNDRIIIGSVSYDISIIRH